jgi:hypothetical protein
MMSGSEGQAKMEEKLTKLRSNDDPCCRVRLHVT